MKIDYVLTACDSNSHYLNLFPHVVDVWKKKFNIECHLILVHDVIPDHLKEYQNNIILFKPIEKIHPAFTAQVIRILYPCLYENKNILITDVDIFPISYQYFISSIEKYSNDKFICYRDAYMKQNMLAICYNIANSETWKEIFKINTIDDITNTIKNWYNFEYSSMKNCPGWFTDQQKLFEYVINWEKNNDRLIILKDHEMNFKRLDKRKREYILHNVPEVINDILNNKYTDFHTIKPYQEHKKIIIKIIDTICSI